MNEEIFLEPHKKFEKDFLKFVDTEIAPNYSRWQEQGFVDRDIWTKAGSEGFLCPDVQHSTGDKADFRYNCVVNRVLSMRGFKGVAFNMHSDVVAPLFFKFATTAQLEKWRKGILSGETILAMALTEPNGGSDLSLMKTRGEPVAEGFVINGEKTFITNGYLNDLVVVAARTGLPSSRNSISLFLVESGTNGYQKEEILKKIGLHARDVSRLSFKDVQIPQENLLGKMNRGLIYLLDIFPKERLSIAFHALYSAEACLNETLVYAKTREVFGKPIGKHQSNQFVFAEMKTEIELGKAFVGTCLYDLDRGALSNERSAMAKWWITEMQERVTNRCLQLYGGHGYLADNFVARNYVDNRILSIYGGANEVLKGMIASTMGL